MTSQEAIDIIRTEINRIVGKLLSDYKITLREIKTTQFGIKYEVMNEIIGNSGVLIIYYGKKGYKYVNEKVECQGSNDRVIEVFENRENLSTVKIKGITEEVKVETRYLDKLYKIFKTYENEDFDFTIFSEELLKHCNDDKIKLLIKENSYNFNELERIYKDIIERK